MFDLAARAAMTAAKFALNAKRSSDRGGRPKKVKFYRQRLVLSYDEPLEPMGEFLEGEVPDAIDSFLYRVSSSPLTGDRRTGMTAFDAYVARQLTEAGAAQLRAIAARVPLALVYDEDTARFVLHAASGITPEDRAIVDAVEAALNRALLILIPLDDQFEARYGNENAVEDYSALDWNALACVTRDALACATAPVKKNPSKDVYVAKGEPGGDWDALTRFFNQLMTASMPATLACVADIDTASGLAVVEFVAPSTSVLPKMRWLPDDAGEGGAWTDASPLASAALAHLRLSAAVLLAANAFSSSERVSRVIVNARTESLGGPALLSMEFAHEQFFDATCAGLAQQRALDDERGFVPEPEALLQRLAPTRVLEGDGIVPLSDAEPTFRARRTSISQDARPLPSDLADLLGASAVSDLAVAPDMGAMMRLSEIEGSFEDAPLLAIAQLEELLSQIELPVDDGRPRMAFMDSYARLGAARLSVEPGTRYEQLPMEYAAALTAFARCCRRVDRPEEALAAARQCVACAPSSPDAYAGLGDAYMAVGDAEQAFLAYNQGLFFAVTTQDVGYLYFKMGLLMERLGELEVAVACYSRIPDDGHMWWMDDYANDRVPELCAEAGIEEPSWEDADEVMQEAHILSVPYWEENEDVEAVVASLSASTTEDAGSTFGRLLVRLCDAGMPYPASIALSALNNYLGHDETAYDGRHVPYTLWSLEWVPQFGPVGQPNEATGEASA